MLGKVMKHEFMDTGRVLMPLNCAVLGLSILGAIMLWLDIWADYMMLLLVAVLLVDVLALIALSITSFIYLSVRFYKSMFGSEAYLTHTLPAGGFAKLNGKLLVGFIWNLLSTLLCVLSVFALVAAALSHVDEEIPWKQVVSEAETMLGMSIGSMMGMMLLFLVLSALHGLLMVYASMSIGQLFHKHKIGASVVTYIIFYVVIQVVSALIGVSGSVDMAETMEQIDPAYAAGYMVGDFYSDLIGESLIASAVFTVIFYVITAYICNKKINLD